MGTYLNERFREFEGEAGARYKVSVVDTWDMTEEELPGTFEGKFRIDLPSDQYMLLRLTKAEAYNREVIGSGRDLPHDHHKGAAPVVVAAMHVRDHGA